MPTRPPSVRHGFACPPLEELTRQLLFAPPAKRMEQVRRAEVLHDELDPARNYPLDFVVFRLTGYRRDEENPQLLIGEALLPDLRLLIDRVSESAPLPVTRQEPAMSVGELAQQWNVSTKSIRRWRTLGLRARWVRSDDPGGKRLGFTPQAVSVFQARQGPRVAKAARFTHMTPQQRERLLQRARRLAWARPVTLNQVATHLARRSGRAVETLRQLLEQHDRRHPQEPIFADRTGPLTERQKKVIARAHRMGVRPRLLCERFGRTRSTIYRALRELRADAIRRLPIPYVTSSTFSRPDAQQVILHGQDHDEPGDSVKPLAVRVDDLPEALRPLYDRPGLSAGKQRQLSVRMNYLKHMAACLRDRLDPYDPRSGDMDQIERCLQQAADLRDQLIAAHLRVVLSVTRRHLIDQPEHSVHRLMDLLERGHEVLFDAVEQYDAGRGRTFETYLTWRLLRQYAGEGASPKAQRRLTGAAMLHRMQHNASRRGISLTTMTSS